MDNGTHTVSDLRKACKAAGLRLRVKSYSDFCSARIITPNGAELNPTCCMGPDPEAWAAFGDAFEGIRSVFKGNTYNGTRRVVI